MARLVRQSRIEASAQAVFDWHERPGALQRLIPPWQRAQVLERRGGLRDGDRVTVRTWTAGVPATWIVEHRDYIAGRQFRDLQLKGPFARWEHTHRFEPIDDDAACLMTDEIEYELPMAGVGDALGGAFVKRQLERMFAHRHRTVREDLAEHQRVAQGRTLTIAISGSSGMIGSALIPFLTTGGHRVKRIVRRDAAAPDQIGWRPADGTIDAAAMQDVDVVVHLAGENLVGRWTDDKKRQIRDSRVIGTRGLAAALASLPHKPVFICASAVGYYGNRGDEILTEDSPRGQGFLADVCEQWEQATQPAANAGIRTVNLRFGPVLSPAGGALAKMLPAFQVGLGGSIGDGSDWMPWITIDEAISIIYFAMFSDRLHGPVNAVAPEPVRNRAFVATLGQVLNRPTVLSAPRPALRWMLGELADQMLSSVRVSPLRLAQAGYTFRHTELDPALRQILGR